MKKKIVVLLSLVLVMCTLLCACGVCKTCNDEGEILCTNSKCLDGGIRCDECNGTAKINREECCKTGKLIGICSKCDGKGKYTNPITWQQFVCANCEGDGVSEEVCKYCHGERETYDKCTNCENGSVGQCPTCKGESMIDCPDCESIYETMNK